MSTQQSADEEARMVAKIYSTPFYRKVNDLARNTAGTVYDPRMGPPPPSPALKEFCPIPPSSQAPRPDTPRPNEPYIDNTLIPGKTIVNEKWDENLERVFHGIYSRRDWKDLADMTDKCWKHLRKQKNRNQRTDKWDLDELELFGRLSIWGVHLDVIIALIGWPVNAKWTSEEADHFQEAIINESKYIPVTPEEARANLEERQKELSPSPEM